MRIPRAQQKKVYKFLRKFRADPTNPSINYEKISTFRDPNMRTVRIDQAYRVVILKPEKGNVYVLLWVDNHDEAMAWATNKRVVIHPETGSLQMLPPESPLTLNAPESAPTPTPAHTGPPLYAEFSDEDLTSLGLLNEQLPMVRELRDMGQLEAQIPVLPAEVYEALYFLAAGEPLEEVRRALGIELSGCVARPRAFGKGPSVVDTASRHWQNGRWWQRPPPARRRLWPREHGTRTMPPFVTQATLAARTPISSVDRPELPRWTRRIGRCTTCLETSPSGCMTTRPVRVFLCRAAPTLSVRRPGQSNGWWSVGPELPSREISLRRHFARNTRARPQRLWAFAELVRSHHSRTRRSRRCT